LTTGSKPWLKRLSLLQWTLLTFALTLIIILIVGGAMSALVGIFHAIREISGQTG